MKKLILVCGPAAIGKSTFCKNYAKDHPSEDVIVIAADEIRKELYGSYKAFPPNHDMSIIYDEIVRRSIEIFKTNNNATIMLDTTMLYDGLRLFFLHNIEGYDSAHLYLLKLHDYTICLKRNKMRIEEKWVPDEIIMNMASSYVDPHPDVAKLFDSCQEFYVD